MARRRRGYASTQQERGFADARKGRVRRGGADGPAERERPEWTVEGHDLDYPPKPVDSKPEDLTRWERGVF